MIIIIYNKDWHYRVTYQTSLGIFSFYLVPNKKLSFPPNIYLLSLLLAQFSPGQSSSIESQIKDLLKMENIGTDHKGYIYVHASNNLFYQINKLVSNRDKFKKNKMKHAQKLWPDPYRETWKTSLSTSCSWSDDLPNCPWVVFVTFYTNASYFNFIYAFVFIFNKRTYWCNYI